jgi:hypothetical protein
MSAILPEFMAPVYKKGYFADFGRNWLLISRS